MGKKKMIVGALLITVLLVLGACAPAVEEETVAELQSQITSLEKELSEKEATITSLEKELSAKEGTISSLQGEIKGKDSRITELEEALAAAEVTAPPEEGEVAPPEEVVAPEEQPQVITSDDGKVQIISHSSGYSPGASGPTGTFVTVKVKNLTSSSVDALIEWELYDAAGALISTVKEVVGLVPNETREVTVQAWVMRFEYYHISISTE